MVPPALPTFSITTVWPSAGRILSPMMRAAVSVDPPGGNGTMSVTGRVGYDWAAAIPASADNAVAASSLSMVPLPWRAPSIRLLHNRSMIIALLHPGEMGAAVGACLVQHRVLWASAGRSPSTHARARAAKLED